MRAPAGNGGFGAMTGGSPGTAFGSLTLGAASTAVHERVASDLFFGIGFGAQYRPTAHTHTAYFSSQGPTADGRVDPDVSAKGTSSRVQVTSLAAPTVAGTAAYDAARTSCGVTNA